MPTCVLRDNYKQIALRFNKEWQHYRLGNKKNNSLFFLSERLLLNINYTQITKNQLSSKYLVSVKYLLPYKSGTLFQSNQYNEWITFTCLEVKKLHVCCKLSHPLEINLVRRKPIKLLDSCLILHENMPFCFYSKQSLNSKFVLEGMRLKL